MSQKVEFRRILPSALFYLPKHLRDFLQRAYDESPCSDIGVNEAIFVAKQGGGDIYAVMADDVAIGAVFYMYGQGNNGRILDVTMLGGDKFMDWKDQSFEFTKELAKMKDCAEIWIMGRKGWGEVFPQMEPIGVVYRFKVG